MTLLARIARLRQPRPVLAIAEDWIGCVHQAQIALDAADSSITAACSAFGAAEHATVDRRLCQAIWWLERARELNREAEERERMR